MSIKLLPQSKLTALIKQKVITRAEAKTLGWRAPTKRKTTVTKYKNLQPPANGNTITVRAPMGRIVNAPMGRIQY